MVTHPLRMSGESAHTRSTHGLTCPARLGRHSSAFTLDPAIIAREYRRTPVASPLAMPLCMRLFDHVTTYRPAKPSLARPILITTNSTSTRVKSVLSWRAQAIKTLNLKTRSRLTMWELPPHNKCDGAAPHATPSSRLSTHGLGNTLYQSTDFHVRVAPRARDLRVHFYSDTRRLTECSQASGHTQHGTASCYLSCSGTKPRCNGTKPSYTYVLRARCGCSLMEAPTSSLPLHYLQPFITTPLFTIPRLGTIVGTHANRLLHGYFLCLGAPVFYHPSLLQCDSRTPADTTWSTCHPFGQRHAAAPAHAIQPADRT